MKNKRLTRANMQYLPQSVSSDRSKQSWIPLHFDLSGTHIRFPHSNSFLEHGEVSTQLKRK